MAQWLRHPPVETLVVPGSDPDLAKNLFLHFFLTKMNTVYLVVVIILGILDLVVLII